VHLSYTIALAGVVSGFVVGLTGMGGGALMTPILVLLFKIQPLTAVSSDLVAAMVMKPVGGGVHARRGTVNWEIVKWLCIGSVPSAFAGVLILRSLGSGSVIQSRLKVILGAALLIASTSIVVKSYLQGRRSRRLRNLAATSQGGAEGEGFRLQTKPTLLIGIVGGLLLTRTAFSMQAYIGVIMLAGIVVSNAILLVDYINTLRRRDGMPLREAVEVGGRTRLRPVLMTSIATMLGLVPMAIGIGDGGELQAPLARVVIGGLLASTMVTLVLVPAVYTLFEEGWSGLRHKHPTEAH